MAFRKRDDINSLISGGAFSGSLQGSSSKPMRLVASAPAAQSNQAAPRLFVKNQQGVMQQIQPSRPSNSQFQQSSQPRQQGFQMPNPKKIVQGFNEFVNSGKDGRNFAENAGDMVVGNTARLANTAYSGVVKPIAQLATGQSAKQVQRDINRDLYSDKGGLLDVGTFYKGRKNTAENVGEFGKRFLSAGVGTATEVVPVARGTSIVANAGKAPIKQQLLRSVGEGAGYGAAGSAANQYIDKGNVDLKQVAAETAIGGGLGAVGAGLGAAIRTGRNMSTGGRRAGEIGQEAIEEANNLRATIREREQARRVGETGKPVVDDRLTVRPDEVNLDEYIYRQTPIRDTFVPPTGRQQSARPTNQEAPRTVTLTSNRNRTQPENGLSEAQAGRQVNVEAPRMVRVTNNVAEQAQEADQLNRVVNQARQQEIRNAPKLENNDDFDVFYRGVGNNEQKALAKTISDNQFGKGIYSTPNKSWAETYGELNEVRIPKNANYVNIGRNVSDEGVGTLYDIENGVDITEMANEYPGLAQYLDRYAPGEENYALSDWARDNGFEGIKVFDDSKNGKLNEVITFDENNARITSYNPAPQLEADNGAVLPNRDIAQEIAQAAQERKNRYAPATIREKLGEAINPYRAGARVDAEAARRAGIAQRDLPKTESLEALAERARNSGQEAEEYLRNSNIAPVVQKYGEGTPDGQEFNAYRVFMRDLEQRADGRPALLRNYDDQTLVDEIAKYEAKNPDAYADLKALVQSVEDVQDQAIRRGLVDAETVNAARTKKDGGRYEFYTPVSRATPEELERATINANGVAGGARQTIIQDLKGSDIPLDPSFNSITDYVNNAYRGMAKAETSQLFANRVREGLVPGARFTDTSENSAARKAMQAEQKATGIPKDMNNYAELQADPTTGLQVITGRENGNTFKIEVPPEQARFLQGLGQEQLNGALKLAKDAQTPFRTVLTGALNLPFQAISAGYNAIMSPVLSPQGFRVLAPSAVAESLKSVNRNSEFQQLLRREGAQQFTGNLETSAKTTTAEALAAQRDFASKFKFNATNPGRLWEKLDIPGAKLESAQRTGIAKAAFDARLRNNGNEAEAIADAVYAYNNVLPNFGRQSSAIRQIDALAMYTGASVAGTRSMLTAIKRDPVGVGTRLGLVTTALTGLTAYTMGQDNAEAFYEDMEASGKEYITANNGILVLPGAHKVTKEEATADPSKKEGEWLGVVKVPLPPELRPVQKAIVGQVLANAREENIPLGDYATALFDFTTGSARTLANPAVDLAYGLATNVDRVTGREIVPRELQRKPISEQKFSTTSPVAEQIGNALGVSPLKVDYLLGKSGFPGQVAKGIGSEGGPIAAAAKSVENRFTNTFGQKESTKFFNRVDEIAKDIPNDDDMKAFESLHADKGDGAKSIDKTAERYKTLIARPAVLEAERKLDQFNRQQGKPGNPLFDLSPEQQEKVFRYRASKDLNSAKQAYDKNGNPLYTALGLDEKWYDDFRNAESNFYQAIKQSGDEENSPLSLSGAVKPTASPELQQKLDFYYTLPSGTGERSQFLKANGDVLEHWAKGDQFTNAERVAIGLKPMTDDDGGNTSSGNATFANSGNSSNRRGSGRRSGGRSGGGSGKTVFIKASTYDDPISVDKAPSATVTVKNDKAKVQVKKRQPRKAKVTSTKSKA